MTHFKRKSAFYAAMICSLLFCNIAPAKSTDDDFFVRCEFSKSEIYCYECVNIVYWLYTTTNDFAYINKVPTPHLKNGNFSFISQMKELPAPKRKEIKGREYAAYPISAYIVAMKDAGTFSIDGDEFEFERNNSVFVEDEYRGLLRKIERTRQLVKMPRAKFKVVSLPKISDDISFSGAVGEFEVQTLLPPGDIIVNEDARVIIVVRGKGLLGSDILPEYREAFGTGNKLKSFEQKDNAYFHGNSIISEKRLECEFVPDNLNNCEIGVVRFCFFNPKTRKYEIVESSPIKIEVKSSAIKVEPYYI